MSQIKPSRIAVSLVVLVGLGFYLWPQESDIVSLADPSIPVGVHFNEVQLIGRDQGQRQWEVISQTMRTEENMIFLDQLKNVILLQDNLPKYQVQACSGIWDKTSDSLRFLENVILEEDDGLSLQTNMMVWYNQTERLEFYGETRVEFR